MFQTGQFIHEKGDFKYINIYIHITGVLKVSSSLSVCLTHRPCASFSQHGQQLYRHIYLGCKEQSSGRQHYETLFALLGLLSVELANEEVVVDLIRLALALQVAMYLICYFYLYNLYNCGICCYYFQMRLFGSHSRT